jgi:hypothetical protein
MMWPAFSGKTRCTCSSQRTACPGSPSFETPDETAFYDQIIADNRRFAWRPYHLLDRIVLVEPRRWGHSLLFALFIHVGTGLASIAVSGLSKKYIL